MIRFTVLLGDSLGEFLLIIYLAHEVILNGKLRINFIYLQCYAALDLSRNDTEAVK